MQVIKLGQKNWSEVIKKTTVILNQGGLVISPSDTVYGLLVRADNDRAVKKLIKFKNRPPGKAISVFLRSIKEASSYVFIDKKNYPLMERILPGRYTVVLNSRHKLSPLLEAENGTLGIRVVKNSFINSFLGKLDYPLTATSANLAGQSSIHSVNYFLNRISVKKKQLVDLVIDAGKLPANKPSTIIDLSGEEIKTLRVGDEILPQEKETISLSEKETKKAALDLLAEVKKKINKQAVVILLRGQLGVGKTVFVRAIGKKLGIRRIPSPTFVIYYRYPTIDKIITNLYHFDLYRLQETDELRRLKIDSFFKKGNLICIEWGEKMAALINQLKKKVFLVDIKMEYRGEKKRLISISFWRDN